MNCTCAGTLRCVGTREARQRFGVAEPQSCTGQVAMIELATGVLSIVNLVSISWAEAWSLGSGV